MARIYFFHLNWSGWTLLIWEQLQKSFKKGICTRANGMRAWLWLDGVENGEKKEHTFPKHFD